MIRRRLLGSLKYLVISLLSLMILIPFWAMIVNSLKSGVTTQRARGTGRRCEDLRQKGKREPVKSTL